MITFFKEIFEYHFDFNQKLFAEIEQHLANLPKRSFPLFCHILNAHQIWNARILSEDLFGVNQMHEISDCPKINQDNYANTINILDQSNLGKQISYQNSKGEKFNTKSAISFFMWPTIPHIIGGKLFLILGQMELNLLLQITFFTKDN